MTLYRVTVVREDVKRKRQEKTNGKENVYQKIQRYKLHEMRGHWFHTLSSSLSSIFFFCQTCMVCSKIK